MFTSHTRDDVEEGMVLDSVGPPVSVRPENLRNCRETSAAVRRGSHVEPIA